MADGFEVSVVAPCFNEEANIAALARRLFDAVQNAELPCQLILVDDGSADGTWAAIQAQREHYGDAVVGVRHSSNRGIPDAWRSGLAAAAGKYVCLIDADLQNPPEEVVNLYHQLLESRCDLAQGVRLSIGRVRGSRQIFSRTLNALLNLTFEMRARDNKSGFVLGPRHVIDDILEHEQRFRHFQTFLGASANAKRYSVLEVETLFTSRNAGESFLDFGVWRVVRDVLRDFPPALWEFRLHGRRHRPQGVSPRIARTHDEGHPYSGWRRLLFEIYFASMPVHKWLIRRRARDLYLELRESQWLPRGEIRALQRAKLRRLLQHAYAHVPYYREAMDQQGVRPEDIETIEDLALVPMLSKDTVRKRVHFQLFADNHRKRDMQRIATSGSTGEPLVVYADRHQLEMRFATTLRAMEWTGWRFGDRQARLWHQTLGMTRSQRIRERVDAWLMRRLFIPAFDMRPENIESFVAAIRAHRPVLVDGYAESFNFLAAYIRSGAAARFSPKAIMSSAQVMPDNVRRVIEDGLRTKVFDKYGAREFSGIAYQCGSSDDHHVMDESYIVEVLVDNRPARPGETGEVVITDLNNFSVPLIRYRIGDLATAVDDSTPCPCGRSLSRIGRIEGRTQAIVHCGNGTWQPGTFFAHFFKDHEYAIRFFQVHQTQKGAFTLQIVQNDQFSDQAFAAIMEELRRYVGDEMQTAIDVEFVDEIPLVRTGKRSPVVSSVREDFQSLTVSPSRPAP